MHSADVACFIERRLRELNIEPLSTKPERSEELLRQFEHTFKLKLPADYRCFLEVFGNCLSLHGAVVPLPGPSPLGSEVCIDSFLGFKNQDEPGTDLRWLTEIADCAPAAVPIADDLFGNTYYLMCAGKQKGTVLFNDHDGRADWPDDEFHRMFDALAPEIRRYLELRAKGEVRPDPVFPPHFYRVAASFSELLERICVDPSY